MIPKPRKTKVEFEFILSRFRPGYIAKGSIFALRGYEEKAVRRHIIRRYRCQPSDIYHLAISCPDMWD